MAGALRQQGIDLGGSTERKNLVAVGVAAHHVQGTGANRAAWSPAPSIFASTEYTKSRQHHGQRQGGQQRVDAVQHPTMAGQQHGCCCPSAPALRLTRDSTKSPTTLMAAMNKAPSQQQRPAGPAASRL